MKRVLRILLLAVCALVVQRTATAAVFISVAFAPPALPVYDLPPCPGDGYLWTPGYWAYDPDSGYYWVPGTWIVAPQPGFLWTPGWWGWGAGGYLFHEGFWGPHIGFYGGINYGFGYYGVGFVGGRWDGGIFRYNTAVFNVNTTIIHNTYIDRTVIENRTVVNNHVAYNGGQGGIVAHPSPEEQHAAQEHHLAPVATQQQHLEAARSNPQMRASVNQGRPAVAATSRPGELSGSGAVAAREAGAPYHAPATHASELQPHSVNAPNTGDANRDQQYQKEQQSLVDKQNQEHQALQQKQNEEDQRAKQQNYSPERQQQMEQHHTQQTQQLEQRHSQQAQELQRRQAPSGHPH